jgi:hypothetical protein
MSRLGLNTIARVDLAVEKTTSLMQDFTITQVIFLKISLMKLLLRIKESFT